MTSPFYDSYIKSRDWYAKTADFQRQSGKRCSLLPWLSSNVSHHLTYKNLGDEKYIRDCVPLSHTAHHWIHFGFIGSWFWDERKVRLRRSVMNLVIRIMALCVTLYAKKYGMRKPKLKNKKRGKKAHV